MKSSKSLFLLLGIILVAGCVRKAPPAAVPENLQPSGFLKGHYHLLKARNPDVAPELSQYALKAYKKPGLNITKYSKIILDPVLVYRDVNEDQSVSRDRTKELADLFYSRLHDNLAQSYQIVRVPAPDAIRLQIALTHVNGPNPVLSLMSTVVPVGRAVSEVKGAATGTDVFVGEAGIEAKMVDSMTDTLLAAGMDRRYGTKGISKIGRTQDVKDILEWWADVITYRLCLDRGDSNCKKPSEWH